MNREQIIKMAREAEEVAQYVTPQGSEYKDEFVLRFAAAIRSAVKEEDARICDEMAVACRETKHESFAAVPEECAKVIRASK